MGERLKHASIHLLFKEDAHRPVYRALHGIDAGRMGTLVLKEILAQTGLNPASVDEVIIGNVLSANLGQNVARQVAFNAGIPYQTCAYSVNMVCGSGLKAVINGYNSLLAGQARCIVAGGVENMSRAPYLLTGEVRMGIKLGNDVMIDHILRDALTDALIDIHMGITGENVAERHQISREEQDRFACQSQKRAIEAIRAGKFKREIVPIEVPAGKGKTVCFDTDEYPREDTTIEKLSMLKPVFKRDGTVTAGNASGINDGAAILLLGNETLMEDGLVPQAEIVAAAQCGVPLEIMGMGAYAAIRTLMLHSPIPFDQIGLIEINEAFAAQSLGVIKELARHFGCDQRELESRINIRGGAIALGHPVGASGARILTTLLHTMKDENVQYGVAAICIGGGMGVAVLVRNCCYTED